MWKKTKISNATSADREVVELHYVWQTATIKSDFLLRKKAFGPRREHTVLPQPPGGFTGAA